MLTFFRLLFIFITLYRIFSHPNILPVLGACQSPPSPHPIIITHYMPYGSLHNILHQGTSELFKCMCEMEMDIISIKVFLFTLTAGGLRITPVWMEDIAQPSSSHPTFDFSLCLPVPLPQLWWSTKTKQ